MRHAVIMAGGSGVRLWPMSRQTQPKQLIPFIGGRSLMQLAAERLEGLVPEANRYICAGEAHREPIRRALGGWPEGQYLGEPAGRDTLAAVTLSAAVIGRRDPGAVLAIFTADHLIEPVEEFQRIVARGYELVERCPETLATFGIAPDGPSTAYGYLELGEEADGGARRVRQFHEKPADEVAREYFAAGPERYLWNSGMFVWRAATLLDCVRRYQPATHAALEAAAEAWETPRRAEALAAAYAGLRKVSVDYAVMEPASRDPLVRVAAVPMPIRWLDVGSWPAYARTLPRDGRGNAAGARALLHDSGNNLVASSDPNHLVAVLGCEDLIVIHTPDATLVCRADRAEEIKKLHAALEEEYR
jgi:mannose-1-phosphate guanylyltransferase